MLHRQKFASRNMSEELQTLVQAFIRVFNYVKNSSLRGGLCGVNVMIRKHNTWCCYTMVKHAGLLLPKHYTGCLK